MVLAISMICLCMRSTMTFFCGVCRQLNCSEFHQGIRAKSSWQLIISFLIIITNYKFSRRGSCIFGWILLLGRIFWCICRCSFNTNCKTLMPLLIPIIVLCNWYNPKVLTFTEVFTMKGFCEVHWKFSIFFLFICVHILLTTYFLKGHSVFYWLLFVFSSLWVMLKVCDYVSWLGL